LHFFCRYPGLGMFQRHPPDSGLGPTRRALQAGKHMGRDWRRFATTLQGLFPASGEMTEPPGKWGVGRIVGFPRIFPYTAVQAGGRPGVGGSTCPDKVSVESGKPAVSLIIVTGLRPMVMLPSPLTAMPRGPTTRLLPILVPCPVTLMPTPCEPSTTLSVISQLSPVTDTPSPGSLVICSPWNRLPSPSIFNADAGCDWSTGICPASSPKLGSFGTKKSTINPEMIVTHWTSCWKLKLRSSLPVAPLTMFMLGLLLCTRIRKLLSSDRLAPFHQNRIDSASTFIVTVAPHACYSHYARSDAFRAIFDRWRQ